MQIGNEAGAYPRWAQRISRGDGTESVRCRIRGKHLRAISFRHLSKYEIDRDTTLRNIVWRMTRRRSSGVRNLPSSTAFRCSGYLGVLFREHGRSRMTRFWYRDR